MILRAVLAVLVFVGALLVALKVCGVVTWSWGWVAAPLLAAIGIAAVLLIIAIAVVVMANRGDSQ